MKQLFYLKKIFCSFLFIHFTITIFAQDYSFTKYNYNWPTSKPDISAQSINFSTEDLVVIDEHVSLNLLGDIGYIKKNCVLKINTEQGVKKFTSLVLPESFDGFNDQMGMSRIVFESNTPYLNNLKIIYFVARKLKKTGEVEDCTPEATTKKIRWVKENGEYIDDFNYWFLFNKIEAGDILEFTYQLTFTESYPFNHYYFNSTLPKQNTELIINCLSHPVESYDFICNMNIDNSNFQKSITSARGQRAQWKYVYNFKNLKPITYSINSCIGKELPHLKIDYSHFTRGPHFEWLFWSIPGKNNKIYTKQYASIRKYLSKLPKIDSVGKEAYLVALNKGLNDLTFVSAESMNNSENAQYSVGSGEWLTKGKLIEEFMLPVYEQILMEANIPFKFICLHDKRLGELKKDCRAEIIYERYFLAVPDNNSLLYLLPREKGRKYLLREIPFYYEGVTAAIMANKEDTSDFRDSSLAKKDYKFIKTQSSTENDNVRTENAVFKVNPETNTIYAQIKESLIGQFSTLVRPLYLNETTDNTINPVYLKKCVSKPNAIITGEKLTSKSDHFPFKYTFNCSENIALSKNTEISLRDWFSFTYNRNMIPQKPGFDYYVDFRYTDMYNYLFEFSKPTDVINLNDFTKSINNPYVELTSKLVKQTENSYLLNVIVKVKQSVIPETDGETLVQLANNLDELNNLVLKFK